MVLYARNDIIAHHSSSTGHSHARPQKSDGKYVPLWGIDCPPCEAELSDHPAWSRSRYKLPPTPDEVEEAEEAKAAAEAALHQHQLALARQSMITEMAGRNAHPEMNPEDVAISTGSDAPPPSVETGSNNGKVNESDYAVLTVADLKDIARDLGLPVSGTRKELVTRIVEAQNNGNSNS